MTNSTESHRWRFFRAGGSDQVELARGSDLVHLAELDPKLWVALACPVAGLELDERTLRLMDTDGDGRIRVPEVLAAVEWTCGLLKDPESVLRGGDLRLSDIDESNEEGRVVAASAREILANLGKSENGAITVSDSMQTTKVFSETRFNGDGVVPVEMIDDDTVRLVADAVVAHGGAVIDRSGKPGVTQATVDAFYADCAAYDSWWREGEADSNTLLPLGTATPAALASLSAVRAKIDDFFARGRLAAFDPRALEAVNRREEEYLVLAASDLSVTAKEVSGFPLARIEVGGSLPLVTGVNPAWTSALSAFRSAVAPLLGGTPDRLTEVEWGAVQAALAAHEAWSERKGGEKVESLGIERIRSLLSGPERAELAVLISQDLAKEPEMSAIAAVERLTRYNRDLFQLLNNFVAFRDFYSGERKAVFQAGTLFLDGRSCDLCVRVHDSGKHAALAGLARSYLAYCACTRGSDRMTIAAAFTGGDSDNLMVGRNGVFYDRQGLDWDATITKVIDNPISVGQAFWSPYKKLVRLIEELAAKRAASSEAEADASLGDAATASVHADKVKPEPKKIDVGTVAALGVAFGALATAFAALAGYLSGVLVLPFWQICLAFGVVLLLISTPSMLMAWLKLRQRNLGPILDAGGWAVNGQVKMNVPFGGALTKVATLPTGSEASFSVKYPQPPTAVRKVVVGLLVIAFVLSLLNQFGALRAVPGFSGETAERVRTDGGVP